jgi:hypothetical protein
MNSAERRITLRLLAYWEKQRRGRLMPEEDDINPDDIRDLWDCCFLLHVTDLQKTDYNYTYLGQAIIDAYHHGVSKGDASGVISPHASALAPGCRQVAETCKPLLEEGEFVNLGQKVIRYRQCLLPLGQDNKVVAVFGGMRFKIFSEQTLEPKPELVR